jgi:hypothetical protein
MRDDRIGPGLYADVLDVLARHGFSRGDDQHAGRAVVLIGDLARIFEGSQDHPMGYARNQVTHLAPADGSRAGRLRVLVQLAEVKTVMCALDIAAGCTREHAGRCPDCEGYSCSGCRWRLRSADAYDQLAIGLYHAIRAPQAASYRQPGPAGPPGPGPGKEAGQ